ncbi:pro-resilin-like [Rhagoletis pomonella]|uniref:pro-resilin-like n=1 Tax=Rhagoletis pomonella TaxID=28610 RepID=UPI00177CF31D|nr:pro-resilin-like [Rhagoletis pomonella]
MKFLYLLLLLLPILEARLAGIHQRFIRQTGRYGTPGGYRPNLAYTSNSNHGSANSNSIGIGGSNTGNSYSSGNVNANGNGNGNVRLAYVPASGAVATRPYNGVGGFKFGGRPSPGSDFVVNAVSAGAGGPGGGYSANHPQTVYKNVGGSGGRPQANTAYRIVPGPLASGGRPVAAVGGSGGYQSGGYQSGGYQTGVYQSG